MRADKKILWMIVAGMIAAGACMAIIVRHATPAAARGIDLSSYAKLTLPPPNTTPGAPAPPAPVAPPSRPAPPARPEPRSSAKAPQAEMPAAPPEGGSTPDVEKDELPPDHLAPEDFTFRELPLTAHDVDFPLVLVWQDQLEFERTREMDPTLTGARAETLADMQKTIYRIPKTPRPPPPGPRPPRPPKPPGPPEESPSGL